jgi:hypothetical protein
VRSQIRRPHDKVRGIVKRHKKLGRWRRTPTKDISGKNDPSEGANSGNAVNEANRGSRQVHHHHPLATNIQGRLTQRQAEESSLAKGAKNQDIKVAEVKLGDYFQRLGAKPFSKD